MATTERLSSKSAGALTPQARQRLQADARHRVTVDLVAIRTALIWALDEIHHPGATAAATSGKRTIDDLIADALTALDRLGA